MGFSSLLLAHPEDLEDRQKLRHYLEAISTAGEDAAQTVRRLREFYRPREEVEVFWPVSMDEAITSALALTEPRWKAQAQAAGGTIHVETVLSATPTVNGQVAELRDVLINLIFNAVDAIGHGGTLTIRSRFDAATSTVVVEVADTGMGMTEEVRRRCLEPFFTTKGERGTGLGLATSYGIIQRHGGSIGIESTPGKGTTMILRLPAMSAPGMPSAGPTAPTGRHLQVLVVEDEPGPLAVLVAFVSGDGHTVETATNGLEGLRKFQQGWYDVVITDMAMPEMNGAELARNIKRVAPKKPVIIMLTGLANLVRSDPQLSDVDIVLYKPITLTALRDTLSNVS